MPRVTAQRDGRVIIAFASSEVKEIDETWMDELIQKATGGGRKWRAHAPVIVQVETWVEPEGRTFDV